MILKVNIGGMYEWKYFEGDQIELRGYDWRDRNLLNTNAQYILNPKVENRSEGIDTPGYHMKLVLVINQDVMKYCILTDCLGYVLNNEGKTIDKL